jgi:pseudouridine-5'-phosphate glycosidase
MSEWMNITPEVEAALRAGRPVVALESTLITHGLPRPVNLETAQSLEDEVRRHGAVPATIAILDGVIHVGLADHELERLATADDVVKVSRRDLPAVIAKKKSGATTVAATMICAERAGIRVFATGGIGGVHRGAAETMDISADLQELARTRVAVVCAGAKAILDIGLTLEVLETLGVPVVGYQTDEFPAFYSRSSGHRLEHRVETPEEAARLIRIKEALGMGGGVLIANPVPERDALDAGEIEAAIEAALAEAQSQGIRGKDVTPFLLEHVRRITQGRSLAANVALLRHNAAVAAQIAAALAGLG